MRFNIESARKSHGNDALQPAVLFMDDKEWRARPEMQER